MRSSTLNRIKEIGVYRAIGATKRDIYKIFFTEILSFSLITILPGYLFVSYFVYQMQTKLIEFQLGFYLTLPLFAIGLVGLFIVNIVFGMLPIFNLLRKTPAQILAKYDI
jgi:ABC-type antimicrobial peptide transport system permease subunit